MQFYCDALRSSRRNCYQSIPLSLGLIYSNLGKGQGTPMLKDGIHLVGVELDEESEASDWQGFD
jgi:hypothetical protein